MQTEAYKCTICREKNEQLSSQGQRISEYETERECLSKIFSSDESKGEVNIILSVENMIKEAL